MIALSFITNNLLSKINGREIFSLSILSVVTVFPVEISTTNNLPLLVVR